MTDTATAKLIEFVRADLKESRTYCDELERLLAALGPAPVEVCDVDRMLRPAPVPTQGEDAELAKRWQREHTEALEKEIKRLTRERDAAEERYSLRPKGGK
jgi:hypothetical protein